MRDVQQSRVHWASPIFTPWSPHEWDPAKTATEGLAKELRLGYKDHEPRLRIPGQTFRQINSSRMRWARLAVAESRITEGAGGGKGQRSAKVSVLHYIKSRGEFVEVEKADRHPETRRGNNLWRCVSGGASIERVGFPDSRRPDIRKSTFPRASVSPRITHFGR